MQQRDPIDEPHEPHERQPWIVPVFETTKLNDALTGNKPYNGRPDATFSYAS